MFTTENGKSDIKTSHILKPSSGYRSVKFSVLVLWKDTTDLTPNDPLPRSPIFVKLTLLLCSILNGLRNFEVLGYED